jgi:putative GTP pyrophosphokinase
MDEAEILTKYAVLQPLYQRLLVEVEATLAARLKAANVNPAAMSGRVKEPKNVVDKASRKGYSDPFAENDDFAGLRVVCRYTPELDKVETIIKTTFNAITAEDKSASRGVDRMA